MPTDGDNMLTTSNVPASVTIAPEGGISVDGTTEAGQQTTVAYERVLGHLPGLGNGPTLICVAGLHGNEPAGVLGLQLVFASLVGRTDALRGTFLGLVGNRRALTAGSRYLDEDLNRIWTSERLERLRSGSHTGNVEEHEMRALDLELRAAIENATGPVSLLDLHTTSAPGPSFIVLNDTLPNRALALQLPAPVVLGLEEELGGTLLTYLARHESITSIGFESGQHDDPESIPRAAAAVWLALQASGVIDAKEFPEVAAAHKLLETSLGALPPMVDVHYRHHIEPADNFQMLPGYAGFQRVSVGTVVANDHQGTVTIPNDGMLLMPLYQGQGDDGFFLVREVRPIWLRLSAALRRFHLEGFLHWLPGIHRHESIPDAVTVDLWVARLLAVEFFHLLGFSRVGAKDDRYLVMRRRRFDRTEG